MTTVRVVPTRRIRPKRAPDGSDVPGWWPHQRLIVLADAVPTKDGGHRAVPLYVFAGHKGLLGRLGRPVADAEVARHRRMTGTAAFGTPARCGVLAAPAVIGLLVCSARGVSGRRGTVAALASALEHRALDPGHFGFTFHSL